MTGNAGNHSNTANQNKLLDLNLWFEHGEPLKNGKPERAIGLEVFGSEYGYAVYSPVLQQCGSAGGTWALRLGSWWLALGDSESQDVVSWEVGQSPICVSSRLSMELLLPLCRS